MREKKKRKEKEKKWNESDEKIGKEMKEKNR